MKRKLTKAAIVIVTILLAQLVYASVHTILIGWQERTELSHPYLAVIISMILAVAIFYPAFYFIESLLKPNEGRFLRLVRKITANRFTRIAIGFALVFFLLFLSFSQLWFDKNLLEDLRYWVAGTV
ncbi:MAG TPA: hypothetical protein VIK89_03690 [Cytophagaceae bacterium]